MWRQHGLPHGEREETNIQLLEARPWRREARRPRGEGNLATRFFCLKALISGPESSKRRKFKRGLGNAALHDACLEASIGAMAILNAIGR